MSKRKQNGINARAWFYSTSFHSNLHFEPSAQLKQTVADLKRSLAELEAKPTETKQESR